MTEKSGRLREWTLNVAAACGSLCILMTLAAIVFNISLIMFKTGSMGPTIPAGSLAVVREIPAADIGVGDVVTVDRSGKLPVTHRVTSVTPDGADRAVITMKGDANDTEDPEPYSVTKARLVLWSAPGLAQGVVFLSHPGVMGGITLSVAGFVTWILWPEKRVQPRKHRAEGRATPAEVLGQDERR